MMAVHARIKVVLLWQEERLSPVLFGPWDDIYLLNLTVSGGEVPNNGMAGLMIGHKIIAFHGDTGDSCYTPYISFLQFWNILEIP